MEAVRAFVHAVWTTDRSLDVMAKDGERRAWIRPDPRFGSHEMARIRTNRQALRPDAEGRLRPGPATDFFELYWQHLMGETHWQHVVGWLRPLLLRRPRQVPRALRPAWWTAWGLLGVAAVLTVDGFVAARLGAGLLDGYFGPMASGLRAALAASVTLAGAAGTRLVPSLGEAARYLDDAPGNVLARRAIREHGLGLLRSLHTSGDYDRVVVVGHGLGSVIAYDIVRLFWAERELEVEALRRRTGILRAVEEAAAALHAGPTADDQRRFLELQRRFCLALRDEGAWCITDLVTLGSPLTYAPVLLARDEEELRRLIAERGLPVCPPVLEQVDGKARFTYRYTGDDGVRRWRPHHGAVFAAVRWTNLYFPYEGWFRGDPIGGPVRPHFGPGVIDRPVRSSRVRGLGCHKHYWRLDDNVGPHILELRRALDLACEEVG